MFLPRKCMFKDGSFFLTLVQSGTLLQFRRNITSRWTWENLFMLFGRTYIDVRFVIRIPAGRHIVLAGERLHNAEKFESSWDSILGDMDSTGYESYNIQLRQKRHYKITKPPKFNIFRGYTWFLSGFGHFQRNEPWKDDFALLMKLSFLKLWETASFSKKNSLFGNKCSFI